MKVIENIKKYLINNKLLICFVIFSLINTTLLRFLTVKNYFEIGPFLADLFVLLIISVFSNLFKKKNVFKYFLVWSFIIVTLSIINSVYYTNYVSYASISLLTTALQVVDVGNAIVENIMEVKDLIYLWQIFAFIFIYKYFKKHDLLGDINTKEERKINLKNNLISALIFLILFCFTLSPVRINRLFNKWNREYIVMHYGALVYQFNDLFQTLTLNLTEIFGYDSAYKEFREYYSIDKQYTDNEYTGIFKDKNVIVIHAESIQNYVLNLKINNKEVTPNLNRLAKEGIYFSNFYSEESVGTSSDTEFTFNTSLMPANSGTVFKSYYDRTYNSIPKSLREQGYYTFSMHGNNCDFWIMHINLGYNKYYCYTNDYVIDETIGLGLSDKSFFKQSVPMINNIKNTKFYGVLLMLSNHTPFSDIKEYNDFDVTNTYINLDGKKTTDPFLEDTVIGNYIKSVNYADEAIGELLNDLDSNGLLDNTVIIIYGDHDAKIKQNEYEKYYNYDYKTGEFIDNDDPNYKVIDDFDYEINRKVPFIIWTKDKEFNVTNDTVMGMIDVYPTLGNMFGFKNKYALGNDIFSIKDNVVVFPDGNWLTDKMYYNYQKDEGKLLNGATSVSAKYIEKYSEYASLLIAISNDIIVYDLIKVEEEN